MSVKSYSAPWGMRIRLITGVVVLVCVTAALVLPLVVPVKNQGDRWGRWIVPAAALGVIGGTALWMVRGFQLTDDAVVVRRVLWSNRIPLRTIESAEMDPHACKGAWKTRGNDGLFAMHGRFRSKHLGKFQAYVTNAENAVVLLVRGDTIVISPENPRSFVNELNRRLRRLEDTR